jgi:hypothetical protein
MLIFEKSALVYDIIERDYTRRELIDWIIDIMGEETMDEILANQSNEE